jgi:hypothetical protein
MIAVALLLLFSPPAATEEAEKLRSLRPNPPEDMVDFLGRRRLCTNLGLGGRPGEGTLSAFEEAEWLRLACDRLAEEERGWRARRSNDPVARAWLDDDPAKFALQDLVVQTYDGPPLVRPRRIEQSGTDRTGTIPYRAILEMSDEATTITVGYGDLPPRTLALDAARFPSVDPSTLFIAIDPRPAHRLSLSIRYGAPRGYCSINEQDDRPTVEMSLGRGAAEAHYHEPVNCVGESGKLELE